MLWYGILGGFDNLSEVYISLISLWISVHSIKTTKLNLLTLYVGLLIFLKKNVCVQ